MVVDPSSDDWIQFTDECVLRGGFVFLNDGSHFCEEGFYRVFRRLNQQLSIIFSDILA